MIEYLSPGVVGSVGDVLTQTRLKNSSPDMMKPNLFSTADIVDAGSNVQDGRGSNYYNYGSARVVDKQMTNLNRRNGYGWTYQDVRAPDKTYQPALSQTFSVFDDQKARVYASRITGCNFLPLPGAYELAPGQVPRGGATPRITDLAAGDFTPGSGSVVTNPILAGPVDGFRGPRDSKQLKETFNRKLM